MARYEQCQELGGSRYADLTATETRKACIPPSKEKTAPKSSLNNKTNKESRYTDLAPTRA